MSDREQRLLFQGNIISGLRAKGVDLVGIADISDQNIHGFSRAISMAIVYDRKIVDNLASEAKAFFYYLHETRDRIKNAADLCGDMLRNAGFEVYLPEITNNPMGTGGIEPGEISHKMVATKAGLGWVGKNALLVSPEYGCGMRLGSVLTNAPLIPGTPITESKCGNCRACADACPHQAIHGVTWYPGIKRDELLDVLVCHQKRQVEVPRLGYKPPCGFCIQVCPWDKRQKRFFI